MGGGNSKSIETQRRDRRIRDIRNEEYQILQRDDSNQLSIKKYKQDIPKIYQEYQQSFADREILQSRYKSLLVELSNIQQYVRKIEKDIKKLNKQRDEAKKLTKQYKKEIDKLNDIIQTLNTMLTYLKRIEKSLKRQIEILQNQLNNTDKILEEEMQEFYRLDAYIKDLFFKANTAKPLAEKYGQVYFNSLQQQNESLIQSKFEMNNIQTRSNRLYLYSDYWLTKINAMYDIFLFVYLIIAIIACYLVIYKSTYLKNNYFKIVLAVVFIAFPFYVIPLEKGVIDFVRIIASLLLGKPYEKNNWI